MLKQEEYQAVRYSTIEELHLLRTLIATFKSFASGFTKQPKAFTVMDVHPIEEFDKELRKQQQEQEAARDAHANKVLEQHRAISQKLKEQSHGG